jgi:tight adherence protein B
MIEPWIIYGLVFASALLGVEAISWIAFRDRGTRKSINRRLALSKQLSSQSAVLEALRQERGLAFGENDNWLLQNLNDLITQTGLKLDRNLLVLLTFAMGAILFAVLGFIIGYGLTSLFTAILTACSAVIVVLRSVRSRRMAKLAEQLPDATDVIVRGVRAGLPFTVALGLVAREMPDPIGTEFGMTADEITFGLDAKTAIENLHRRVGLEDLLFLVVAVKVQSQTGGNLGEILSRLSRLLRDRAKVQLKIRAITAEGRLSAIFLSVMPFLLFVIINFLSPSYYSAVRDHPSVLPAVIFCFISLAIGNAMIYRMVHFKF